MVTMITLTDIVGPQETEFLIDLVLAFLCGILIGGERV
ncbi:MAG: hypothetical protein K0S20_717 [Patescibacteria group bacterium]|jgi:uncharacterized membrane protein YhiD involved in acid resistance|nr:hypothetical protein [Patescibacteria group bacterium]